MLMSYASIDPADYPGTPEYEELREERKARRQRQLEDIHDQQKWDEDHLYRAHS